MVNLKNKRINAGLTQAELGKKVGLSHNVISQYESGIRTPKLDSLIKMAEIFGCTVDELLGVSAEK